MLDIKLIREKPEEIESSLKRRGKDYSLKNILELDREKRSFLQVVEVKKAERKTSSKKIGKYMSEGLETGSLVEDMKILGDEIVELDKKIKKIDELINIELYSLPNILSEDVPTGKSEEENIEIKKWGEPKTFDFEIMDHQDLGVKLGIFDFSKGTEVSGSKFVYKLGDGAVIERALINFMLDLHKKRGYEELWTPYLVNEKSLIGTGQLPKFGEDMFKVEGRDLYLIPTGEVPLTNYFRNEIISESTLPIKVCGFTPCFRSEAGSAGRDTKGLIRMHQFSKVELVKIAHPDNSRCELEELLETCEIVLQELELPYRVVKLCSGDVGFSSSITYDIEVYIPSYNGYKEISSCSLFTDFQGRRAKIRYRDKNGKNKIAHTINGSGLAVGRTIAAIMENYQNKDGSITVPEKLVPYIGKDLIKKRNNILD